MNPLNQDLITHYTIVGLQEALLLKPNLNEPVSHAWEQGIKSRILELELDEAALSQLMHFYNVTNIKALVLEQAKHVEKLQKQLPPLRDARPGYSPREG